MSIQRTGAGVETDIYNLVKESGIGDVIGGGIYRSGLRPRGSEAEDLVVIFTQSDAEQVQGGVVTLNLYVKDISPYGNGELVPNKKRVAELEEALLAAVQWMSVRGAYKFRLREAVHANHDDEIHQSFAVARIGFRFFNV